MQTSPRYIAYAAASAALGLLGDSSSSQAGTLYAVFGAGAASCAAWDNSIYHLDDRREQVSWLYGYVSARSDSPARQAVLRHTSGYSITTWMDGYCARHPRDLLISAADKLLAEVDRNPS